jgi:hypothetical protein
VNIGGYHDQPDVQDASPSPEYRADLGVGMAAEQTADRQSGNGDSTQKPADEKPDAKDPTRPRRKKARRACLACQRSHLTCGECRYTVQVSGKTNMFKAMKDRAIAASSANSKIAAQMACARRQSTHTTYQMELLYQVWVATTHT